MSKTNLEHYQKELEKIFNEEFANTSVVFDKVKKNCDSNIRSCCWTTYTRDILEWMSQPCKEPILDDVERKYLSAIIKPFKNYVTGIIKIKDDYKKGKQYIRIIVKKYTYEYINMPLFEENKMYKGMKENKTYTLKELGL